MWIIGKYCMRQCCSPFDMNASTVASTDLELRREGSGGGGRGRRPPTPTATSSTSPLRPLLPLPRLRQRLFPLPFHLFPLVIHQQRRGVLGDEEERADGVRPGVGRLALGELYGGDAHAPDVGLCVVAVCCCCFDVVGFIGLGQIQPLPSSYLYRHIDPHTHPNEPTKTHAPRLCDHLRGHPKGRPRKGVALPLRLRQLRGGAEVRQLHAAGRRDEDVPGLFGVGWCVFYVGCVVRLGSVIDMAPRLAAMLLHNHAQSN